MARTAPAPNIPPIPGMCPSIAVMGGGGGGGGGSGDGSGDGDGSGGPGGDGNGENANGDSRGAGEGGACGGSGSSSCNAHDPSSTAGDPVDVATGRVFTMPAIDLLLHGPLPLRFARVYSSVARRRDVGFGHGWLHSFAWEVEERREAVVVYHANGSRVLFPRLEVGQEAIGRDGLLLRRTATGYFVDPCDGSFRILEPCVRDAKRARLAQVVDPNSNALTLKYDDRDRLIGIVDSVGRQVRVSRTAEGRISSLEVFHAPDQRWVRFASYVVDDANHLVLAEDAVGARSRYGYDDRHLLLAHERPTGLTFHYVYDDQARCVETWGTYADGRIDPAFGPETSRVLADGSKAKGLHHIKLIFLPDGHRELVTVRTVSRFIANEHGRMDKGVVAGSVTQRAFDDKGFESRVEDAAGGVWQYLRDARGRQLRVIDPLGNTTIYRRDASGRTTETTWPNGGVTQYTLDANGNLLVEVDPEGGIESYRRDERGRIVSRTSATGETRSFRWDHMGNLVETRDTAGAVYRYEFDYFGRRVAVVNPNGNRFEYVWSLRHDLLKQIDPLGNVTACEYDGDGRRTRVVRPDGTTFEYTFGGLKSLAGVKKPDGAQTRIVYDIDERPLKVVDENGEAHLYEWSLQGRVAAKHRSNGHVTRYRHDNLGRVTRVTTSSGERLDLEYDACSRIVSKTFRDGAEHRFAYDATGRVIKATTPGTEVRWERNAIGKVVREIQVVGDDAIEIRTHYRPDGSASGTTSSKGYDLQYAYSPLGFEVTSGESSVVALELDMLGADTGMFLPEGARIESDYDAVARPVRRVVKKDGAPRLRPDEPEWVGRVAGDTELRYAYSPVSNLIEVDDGGGAATRSYKYDPRDRLVTFERPKDRIDLAYDNSTNAFPPAGASYAAGGVIERWENWTFETDTEGRVTRKYDAATGEGWSYTWNSDGMLTRVDAADGVVITFSYDAFGRRLQKTVIPAGGRRADAKTTRFVWDGTRLLQEVQSGAGRREDRIGRDYLFAFGSLAPVAHADVRTDGAKKWVYYLNDLAGTPEVLVDGAGRVAHTLRPTPWGREAPEDATPLRKQGEYFDHETGLVYNRFRYLDPRTGRFLSPDPQGLGGGLNLYVAGPNQVTYIDPFGLAEDLADRTGAMRENQGGSGWGNTTALARTTGPDPDRANPGVIATNNSGSLNPATVHRDPGMENSRGTPGSCDVGVTEDEWRERLPPDTNPSRADIPNPHHAERRAIMEAEREGRVIREISATNNACPTCRAALRRHNPDIIIRNPDGTIAPNP